MIFIIAALIILWVVTVWVLGWKIHHYQQEIKWDNEWIEALTEYIHALENPKLTHFEKLVREHKERIIHDYSKS